MSEGGFTLRGFYLEGVLLGQVFCPEGFMSGRGYVQLPTVNYPVMLTVK